MTRPTKYTNELAEEFCLELIEGKSVREICKGDKYPSMTTIFNWLNSNHEFLVQYEIAKDMQADILAEDILSIADNAQGEVQRDRLRIDARKWIASKLKPKKYGQASQIEIIERFKNKNINLKDLTTAELMKIARGDA
jgi:hypothetical protein